MTANATNATTTPRAAALDLLQDENDQLMALLRGLSAVEWTTESLCRGWTVRDVTAHLAAQHLTGQLRFLTRLTRARGAVDALNAAGIEALQDAGTPELLAGLAHGYRLPFFKFKPQMALFETVIHQQDIRRPLGAERDIPAGTLRVVLGIALNASASRTAGLRFEAADLQWAGGDSGPVVTGRGEALLMAICGRPAALADLTGAGLGILASRVRGETDEC